MESYLNSNIQGYLSIADYLAELYNFATFRDTKEIYIYRDGVYRPNGEAYIEEQARSLLGDDFTTHRVKEIANSIRYSTYVNRYSFDADENVINVENGLLNIKTSEFKLHTPRYLSLVQFPISYNHKATCPNIINFLSQVLNEDEIPLAEELVGYCLLPKYPHHKAFMFQGDGRNGKSTFLNLVQRLLGSHNCSSVDLTSLCNDRFAVSQLFGKRANIFSDLPAEALKTTGMFKALTGGDRVPAQRKFQNPFEFTNQAKLIFSCNYVPMSYDTSPAFFSRWIIIHFPNTFEGDSANPNILIELTTDDELSGFLNLAIEGLNRLLKNNGFSYNKSREEVAEEYQRMSNPVSAFISDCIEEDMYEYIVKDELYNTFKNYCKEKHYPKFSDKKFTEWLKKEVRVTDFRPSVNGQQKRAWQGIKLSSSLPFLISSQGIHDIHDFSNLSNTIVKEG